MQKDTKRNFVMVTGLSGSGKSQVMKCFEEQNYYCADNIPPVLLPELIKLCFASNINRLAVATDIRSQQFFSDLTTVLEQLEQMDSSPYIVFLDASDEVLVRRYAESRRQHPLAPNDRVLNGIIKERDKLRFLRERASLVLDTSQMTTHQLRGLIFQKFSSKNTTGSKLHAVSFGFKYGTPTDVDLIFDCRFLPNPYYLPELRGLSGLDEPVKNYLHSFATYHTFLQKIVSLLIFLLPQYLKEGKQQVNVAFGCTGGRHRSVALAEEVASLMKKHHCETSVEHRDTRLSPAESSNSISDNIRKNS
ncbi:MAG: RNase adapter RapZ [Candidatus Bruticola sp.]